ncbi:MAG: ABC-type transport auxiliary lipoprotein family protein [Blastomonas sp.]
MTRKILVLSLAAMLASCVSLSQDPPPQLLTLTSDAAPAAGAMVSSDVPGAIVVEIPDAERAIDTNRIPVQVDDSAIAYVKDAIWVDKPARLFRNVLAETLAAQTGRLVLDQPEAGGEISTLITGELQKFGYDAGAGAVIVRYDAVLRVPGQPLRKRRFEAQQDVFTVEPRPVAQALNRASNRVAAELAAWVQQ